MNQEKFEYKPRPDGYTISTRNGVRKLNHIWEWEKHFGPVPRGFHVHHKNGKRNDNRIDNLEILKPLDHARLHAGCYKNKKGDWVKPCNTCKKHLPLIGGYYGKGFGWTLKTQHECKKCHLRTVLIRRNRKKLISAQKALNKLLAELEEVSK